MLDKLTKASFDPFLSQIFYLQPDNETTLPLELVEISARPRRDNLPSWFEPPVPLRLEPFSIIFRGPATPALPQQLYTLTHDQMGKLEGLFLVPIAADRKGRYYEATFN